MKTQIEKPILILRMWTNGFQLLLVNSVLMGLYHFDKSEKNTKYIANEIHWKHYLPSDQPASQLLN